MAELKQPDLFGDEARPEPFGEDTPAPVYRPDPDKVRARLHRILAEARAAQSLPWDEESARFYRAIFPQMTRSLPDEEAAQLRFEFEAEMERLEAA
ncbi:MAG TPA: hypothetical protein VML01_07150 [Bryobacterales bacterium]|nr:hypothetical protein [Bryobacterales bacterium]